MRTRELCSGLISVVEPTFLRNYFLVVNCHFCKIFIVMHLLHYPVGIICVNLSWMNRLCRTFFHFFCWRLKGIQFSSELHIWRSAFVIVCGMKQPKKCSIRLTSPNIRMPKRKYNQSFINLLFCNTCASESSMYCWVQLGIITVSSTSLQLCKLRARIFTIPLFSVVMLKSQPNR